MKKLFCVLTVVCMLAALVCVGALAGPNEQDEQILSAEPTATATATNAKPVLRGDITADGVVNMKDVLMLRALLCGHVNFNEAEKVWLYGDLGSPLKVVNVNVPNADANADGEINMKDVLAVRKYLAGIGTL